MSDPFVPRVGGTLSAEIAVPDHEREVRFYARVLTTGEAPLWREDLMNSHGMPIIGLGARSEEHADLPVQWMPHIQVADVAASVQRAIDPGGHELMHGMDDAGTSQWAVLLDADGAAFGVVPVVDAPSRLRPGPLAVSMDGPGVQLGFLGVVVAACGGHGLRHVASMVAVMTQRCLPIWRLRTNPSCSYVASAPWYRNPADTASADSG